MLFEVFENNIDVDTFNSLSKNNLIKVKQIGYTVVLECSNPEAIRDALDRWKASEITYEQLSKRKEIYEKLRQKAEEPFGLKLLYTSTL